MQDSEVNTNEASKPPALPPENEYVYEETNYSESLRSFFSLTGGSIFYCLSALSIIYGIAKLMGPLLTQGSIQDALPCITTLNVYELTLLAVLVLIVKLRNVTDDAVSLVVLIAVFLIGSGTVMDVVANNNPVFALKLGWICLSIGLVKLWLLRKHILPALNRIYAAGLILLLYWNFIIPARLALLMTAENVDEITRRSMWLDGWIIMLVGAGIILFKARKTPVLDGRATESKAPFLHSSGMVWVFALVFLGAACAHQYLLAYIFDVQHAFGDYIPLIIIVALLALEFMRYSGLKLENAAITVGLIPLVCILISILFRSYTVLHCGASDIIWSPRFLLGLMSIVSLLYAKRSGLIKYRYVAAVYLVALVLVWPTIPGSAITLNWKFCGTVVAAYLLILAWIRKDAHLAQAVLVLLTGGLGVSGRLSTVCTEHNFGTGELTCILIGLSTVLNYMLFGKLMDRRLAILGFGFLLVPAMLRLSDMTLSSAILRASILLALGVVIWLRDRDKIVAGIFALPILHQLYILSRQMTAWRYILFSFVLLAIGTFVSLKKGKHDDLEQSE